MSAVPMTPRGHALLEAELKHLRSVERPAVIQAISEARQQGDLSENAEYESAREQQAFIEGRISELEGILSSANVIDPTTLNVDHIVFGATVCIEDLDSGEAVTYQLVGDYEADIKLNRISISSPVGRALIGKTEGDVIVVKVPSGEKEYEIMKVEYLPSV